MHKNTRYLTAAIAEDLAEKMVFVGGPRQVGKTTLAKALLSQFNPQFKQQEDLIAGQYLNFDNLQDRQIILQGQLYPHYQGLVVLDELHKYRLWRMLLKGTYDKFFPKINFLVTGSARLDFFRKGGDSLFGRYHYYRLHPFSLLEMDPTGDSSTLLHLLEFGGFPEPLFKGNKRLLRRWQLERTDRVVNQDLRDLSMVREISNVALLASILPTKVGSLLSVKSLSEDLSVSPHTVNHYLELLDNTYLSFRIYPYGANRLKAVKKTPKLYLWDWSVIENKGPRLENLVAAHLLKFCHYHIDYEGEQMELRFLQDVDGREVDFVVLKKGRPLFMVECKYGEKNLSPHLAYYQTRLKIPRAYQIHLGTAKKGDPEKGGMILPFGDFCRAEKLL